MSITLPFAIKGVCIDCGDSTNRDPRSWRCMSCLNEVKKFNGMFSVLLNKAIKAGEMHPAKLHKCTDCGKQAEHYDHRDYRKIMDVQPVCRSCNFRRGPGAWGVAA